MSKLRQFTVWVSAGRGGISCGKYEAHSGLEAIDMAKREKGQWAAVELGAEEYDLRWEAEEDFGSPAI